MASGIYDGFKADLMEGRVDIGTGGDTIKVALLDSSHSFVAGDDVWSDISANEVSGTAYVAGGATLAGQAVTEATTTKWDGTDVTWAASTITARYAVLYDTTNTNSLIACIDFGEDKSSVGADFVIQWHANGIITLA